MQYVQIIAETFDIEYQILTLLDKSVVVFPYTVKVPLCPIVKYRWHHRKNGAPWNTLYVV